MKESPIFTKMFDFVAWIVMTTTKFPRAQRFILAASLQRVTLAAQEALIRAAQAPTPEATLDHLQEAAAQLALVRFYTRLSEKVGLISARQYEYVTECLSEIGKLHTGWCKVAQKPPAKAIPASST
jgi:ABC-type uncharacterized transport system involved in gliding motility auxiliary subunit